MICGNCGAKHDAVQEVKDCYAGIDMVRGNQAFQMKTSEAPRTPHFDVLAAARSIPNARYAVANAEGTVEFWEVRQGTKTKTGRDWTGWTFLDQLVGSPGGFAHYTCKRSSERYVAAIKAISADPEGCLRLFGQKHSVCGACSSDLSHPCSRAAGYGGKCASKHGYWYPTLAEALEILGEYQLEDGSFVKKESTEADRLAAAKRQPTLLEATYDVTNVR